MWVKMKEDSIVKNDFQNELEEARNFFSADKFAVATTGIQIDQVGLHYASCSFEIRDFHTNGIGRVMGGAIFTLADFIFAVSANRNGERAVTASSQITYLNAAKGNVLKGQSRLIKDGKSLCIYEINIEDNLGTKVAIVITTGMKIGG